jgi:CelD/BcsL family acetyltransferase involved in cellulose biosynthesis
VIELRLDDPRWLELLERSPRANAFHHPSWAKLLGECYGYRAFALVDERDGVRSGLPVAEVRALGRRRWTSLPFTDACEPLGTTDGLAEELDGARRAAGAGRVEVRAALPEAACAHGESGAFRHVLELSSDAERVFDGFRRKQVQQPLEKALERGHVRVERGAEAADLTERYYALHVATRRRIGAPVQPRRFFELLWRRMLEPGLGFVLLARAGETTVAGAVFLAWKGTVTYKYSASDPAAWQLRPNNVVLWEAIRWACENGYREFDFGRTDAWNEGLRRFKTGWGAVESPLVYTTVGAAPARHGSGRPRRAAGFVLRRSPAWVCRGVGELLYRYAA